MSTNSAIEWTEASWNPVTGCTKVSPGCQNCYAERMSRRLQAMGHPNYIKGFCLNTHEHILELPLRWKKPRRIFVNSMSDLFHPDVPVDFIQRVFSIMHQANWHCYQILTKRSQRLIDLDPVLPWLPHIWMGVTIENRDYISRMDHLNKTGAHLKFLSLEPLLSGLPDLNLRGIDWVIVGGESGPGSRPMQSSWAIDIKDQCEDYRIPFFFKQWGGFNKKSKGRKLQGRTFDNMPAILSC